jgi:hypothetical protein
MCCVEQTINLKDVKQITVVWFKILPRNSPGERDHDERNLKNSQSLGRDLKTGPLPNIKKRNHWTVAFGLPLRKGSIKQRGIA